MTRAQELIYALVGIGDLTVEKARNISAPSRKDAEKLYEDVVKRGRVLSSRIRTSAPTKEAVTQTKTARTQVKKAATSVGKAVRASTSGSRTQASEQTKVARSQVKAAATSVSKAVRAQGKATRSAARKVAQPTS
jgi:hypothetical protein